MITTLYAILFYLAAIVLIGGIAYRIKEYATTPAPLKIPTTPAPTTRIGVVERMAREVILFESLFKSNKWIWVFGWLFHGALALVLMRHIRYFIDPVWFWVDLIQPFGMYAGFAMIVGLLGLLARRIFVPRVRYISSPSDYLMLILLLSIGTSGLLMRYIPELRTDIVQLKEFFRGLMYFNWQPLPTDFMLLTHLSLVLILMFIFPFSKLLHAPGLFFSPTRNQVDDPREHRHVTAWAAENR